MDMEALTDEELAEVRQSALGEQARRAKVDEGKDLIGEVVRTYMEAARIECPDLDDPELGEYVVGLITGDQDDA